MESQELDHLVTNDFKSAPLLICESNDIRIKALVSSPYSIES
jgi:hypothetical protein